MKAKANHSVKTSPQPRVHGPAAGKLSPHKMRVHLKKKISLGEKNHRHSKGKGGETKEKNYTPRTRNNRSKLKESKYG